MQAPDEPIPELLEGLSAPVGNGRQRLGSTTPFHRRIVARRRSLDQFERLSPEEVGDVQHTILIEGRTLVRDRDHQNPLPSSIVDMIVS